MLFKWKWVALFVRPFSLSVIFKEILLTCSRRTVVKQSPNSPQPVVKGLFDYCLMTVLAVFFLYKSIGKGYYLPNS